MKPLRVVAMVLGLSLVAAIGAAVTLADPIMERRISGLRGQKAQAVEQSLGTPIRSWKGEMTCPPSWRCDACVALENEYPHEVWLYIGSVAHFLVFDSEGRLVREIACGS